MAASAKHLYEQEETTETEEGGCQSSKDEMYVKYISFYYSTLRLRYCLEADVLDFVIPDTINTVHMTVLAPESKESQAMGLIHSTEGASAFPACL